MKNEANPPSQPFPNPCPVCGRGDGQPFCSHAWENYHATTVEMVGKDGRQEQELPPLDTTHGLKIPDDLVEDYDEIGSADESVSNKVWRAYSNLLIERIAKREEELLAALAELNQLKSVGGQQEKFIHKEVCPCWEPGGACSINCPSCICKPESVGGGERWIEIKEGCEMPPEGDCLVVIDGKRKIVWAGGDGAFVARRSAGRAKNMGITHWMPLPAPPVATPIAEETK